jgi:Acetyltransferase (GNAT) domain
MINTEFNPPEIKESYINCLNTCFRDWGNAETFDWCFCRCVADRMPDLIVLRDGGNLVAGSGVTYRRLQLKSGTLDIACMTGSWTLPEARNRGCFDQIIEASRAIARDRGCPLLLAYVTATNSSCRSLISAGSYLLPSTYITSSALPYINRKAGTVEDVPYHDALQNRGIPENHVHYRYESNEWAGQFIHRPRRTRTLRVNGNATAVVETSGEYDRVLQLSAADSASYVAAMLTLRAASAEYGRTLFAFTVAPPLIDLMEAAGFNVTHGYIAALRTEAPVTSRSEGRKVLSKDWPFDQWWIANGDRM